MDSLLWIESSYQIQALSWQDVNFVPEVEDGARPAPTPRQNAVGSNLGLQNVMLAVRFLIFTKVC